VESLRVTAISIAPFLPFTAKALWEQLGYTDDVHSHKLDETSTWGLIPSGQKTQKGLPLFPRIEDDSKTSAVNIGRLVEKNKTEIHSKLKLFIKERQLDVEKSGWAKTGDMLITEANKADFVYYFKLKKIRDKCAVVVADVALKQEDEAGLSAVVGRIQTELLSFVERNPIDPVA
jgi:isoleucyl-tRNA synthetase